jgi:DinB superfamily
MNAKDVIRMTIDNSDMISNSYLSDLSDADLMLRPVDGMNHLAWQLGHLIAAERHFLEAVKPGASPPLPHGFEEAHSKETISSNDPKKFRTKDEYLSLWKAQREATLKVLAGLPDSQLEAPSPESLRSFAPTVGSIFNMIGVHPLMHCGQWVSVRRKLKKPISI